MWYIFKDGQCMASSDSESNNEDLDTRGEIAKEYGETLPLNELALDEKGDIQHTSPAPLTAGEALAQKIAALDAEYQSQFRDLQLAWASASIAGDTSLADSIKSDYTALKAEYQVKLEAIKSGG